MTDTIPILLEPEQLEPLLGREDILLIDLSRGSTYQQFHLPGAVHLDYGRIVTSQPPVGGLLPSLPELSERLSAIGLTAEQHVVAYDDEGGGKAARLLWTLDTLGHHNYSLLNGGLLAWHHQQLPLSDDAIIPTPSLYKARLSERSIARVNGDELLSRLHEPNLQIIDARSPDEYSGQKRYAERAGHIPGAINIEWTEMMNQQNNLRLKPEPELRALLEQRGLHGDRPVVVYCQTHHRSAHTWYVLSLLGYRVSGYEGSWSDWGNRRDTPIEM